MHKLRPPKTQTRAGETSRSFYLPYLNRLDSSNSCGVGNGYANTEINGPGSLSGNGYQFQVHYSLRHRSEDTPGSANDTITGIVELPAGVSLPIGQPMVLTLHDGNKVKVIAEADGKVAGRGGFFE